MPIHQYVIEQRLAQAAQLLLEGDWNVSEVAAIVGYGKASNFAAAFKKRYGVAPVSYTHLLGAAQFPGFRRGDENHHQ